MVPFVYFGSSFLPVGCSRNLDNTNCERLGNELQSRSRSKMEEWKGKSIDGQSGMKNWIYLFIWLFVRLSFCFCFSQLFWVCILSEWLNKTHLMMMMIIHLLNKYNAIYFNIHWIACKYRHTHAYTHIFNIILHWRHPQVRFKME